jgi:hypothetical protein
MALFGNRFVIQIGRKLPIQVGRPHRKGRMRVGKLNRKDQAFYGETIQKGLAITLHPGK